MSDEDQSGDDKSFLARWSQRKHEAKQPDRDAPAAEADVPSGPVAEGDAAPEFDLSSLPKLEDMTATTDITGFLRKGVPEHLRNAALRKSWALDPAIRNYVNPALDYAYDWNTPGGVPGSSEIGAGMDVARLVSQIMGSGEPAAEPLARIPSPERLRRAIPRHPPNMMQRKYGAGFAGPGLEIGRRDDFDGAKARECRRRRRMRPSRRRSTPRSNPAAPQQAVRRHGSAKPLV